jgi:predicted alpha/beta hydrolase family esterase
MPTFPTPEGQSLDSWLAAFKNYRRYMNEDTMLVGHSLGPAFILTLIERLDKPIRAAFLVGGFLGKLKISEFDGINDTFTNREFDWKRIKKNCKRFRVYISDNDPYVPMKKGKLLAKKLRVRTRTVKGAGHFNEECDFKKFNILMSDIRRVLKQKKRSAVK